MMFIRAQFFKMFKLVSASVLTTVSVCFSSYVLLLNSPYRVPVDNSVRDIVIYRVPFNHDSKLVSALWDFWFKRISRQKDRPQRQAQSVLWHSFIPTRKLFGTISEGSGWRNFSTIGAEPPAQSKPEVAELIHLESTQDKWQKGI